MFLSSETEERFIGRIRSDLILFARISLLGLLCDGVGVRVCSVSFAPISLLGSLRASPTNSPWVSECDVLSVITNEETVQRLIIACDASSGILCENKVTASDGSRWFQPWSLS